MCNQCVYISGTPLAYNITVYLCIIYRNKLQTTILKSTNNATISIICLLTLGLALCSGVNAHFFAVFLTPAIITLYSESANSSPNAPVTGECFASAPASCSPPLSGVGAHPVRLYIIDVNSN